MLITRSLHCYIILILHFLRRNPSLTGQEAINLVNDGVPLSGEMEILKQEILAEMRRELYKMKNDIIEGLLFIM